MATAFNVWTPEGNVIPNSGGNTFSNPNVLYEGNAKILSGTVFKMWCGVNGGSTPGVYYFESTDGLSWTPYASNPVISAGTPLPRIFKNGSTYYLYLGFGTISAWTSTDGLSWTEQNASAVVPGGAGAWDNDSVYQLSVVDIIAGTWYGYYGANAATSQPTDYYAGLVTSTDGINWTKSGSNPVIQIRGGNWTFQKINGVYYGWSQASTNYPNIVSGGSYASAISRISGTNPSGPWTQLQVNSKAIGVYTTAPADFTASSYSIGTQVGDPTLVSDGTNCYLYYTLSVSGGAIGLYGAKAIGKTFSQLVQTYEGVVGVPLSGAPQLNLVTQGSDNFSRANANPLGGNWSAVGTFGQLQLVSDNATGITASTGGADYWNPVTWGNDHWAQTTISASTTAGDIGPVLRAASSGAITSYLIVWSGISGGAAGSVIIQKRVTGTTTALVSVTAPVVNNGDTILGVVNGTNLYLYWNGFLLTAISDSSISSGNAGMFIFPNGATPVAQLNAWSGGTFQNAPPINPTGTGTGSLMMMGCGQ